MSSNNNESSPFENLPVDIMGRVLVLCGPARQVARTWASLSQSSKALRGMRDACLDVRHLKGTRVTDAWLEGLATTFTGLTKLDLSFCEGVSSSFTDSGLEHVGKLSNLTTLNLIFCKGITDAGLEHVGKLSNLATLDLSHCRHITKAGVAHLRALLPRCRVAPIHVYR